MSRFLPSRAKIDCIGIGLLDARDARDASTPYIDLTPGYQFLAVGENAPSQFSLVVDRFGVGVNTPFLDRSDPNNQSALFVDGNVRVTGAIMASNLIIYDGLPSLSPNAGTWGIALPSMSVYYNDSVVIGNSNAALACANALLVSRDSWNNWNNAQLRVDNTAGAQLNVGFVGHGAASPAVIQTPPGVPIEFHAGRTAASLNSNYVLPLPSGAQQQLATPVYRSTNAQDPFPHLLIDASGNVGIHTSVVGSYHTVSHSPDPNTAYASTYVTAPATLDVRGTMFASNILIHDYVTGAPRELDQIFFRQSGIVIAASNVGYGDFASASYRFPCNIGVIAPIDDRYAINVGGPIAVSDVYATDLVKADTLVTVNAYTTNVTVSSDLKVSQKLLVNGGIFVPVQAQQIIIAEREIQLAFFGSNGLWYDAVGRAASHGVSSTVIAQSVSTYDGLYFAGDTFLNSGDGVWTILDASGSMQSGFAYEDVTVAQVASNLYTDPSGNRFVAPPVSAWLSSPPSSLDVFMPTVSAVMTSNFTTTEYTAINFNVASGSLSNINYFGTGMSTGGRFGCGIGVMDSVDNQLVSHKVSADIYGLEVSDDSDPEKRLKRALLVGHKNFTAATNPTDFGATLFVTPSMDDYRYFSPLVLNPVAVAQHMYFLPGYNFLTNAIETDSALKPALALLGDGTNFVGINTRAPLATLHVSGDILFTGTLLDGSVAPLTFFHEVQFETASGDLAPAASYRAELNGGVAHMAMFADADSRFGLTVGTGLKADAYHTTEGNQLGEVLVKDESTVAPQTQGGTLITLNSLGIGTFSPSSANALEVLSPLEQKTVVQVKRNGAAPDVSVDLYLSSADVWSFNADSSITPLGGTLKIANVGTNVPDAAAASQAALSTVYSAATGKYHVGINTTNPIYYDGSSPVLLVNGAATIVGDLNVTGRYLRAGQVVIDATTNQSAAPAKTTNIALGAEDVFIGGNNVYINPRAGSLYVGSTSTQVLAAPQAAFQVVASDLASSSTSAPLGQFYTAASAGYLELGTAIETSATSRVRLEYTAGKTPIAGGTTLPGTFQIYNLAAPANPYIAFTYTQFGATTFNNVAFNAPVNAPASKTIVQVHDATGGGDANFNSLLVSCDSGSAGGPVLTLGKVTGSEISTSWKLQGPNATFGEKLGFAFLSTTSHEVMCLTQDGCLGIGTQRPSYGVDVQSSTANGATLAATATTAGVAASIRMTTTASSYTWQNSGSTGCLQLLQAGVGPSTQAVMQVSSNGHMSIGADAAPDPNYSLNMTGNLNIGVGGIFLNGQQLFNVGQDNYVINSRLQYFIPGYGGVANPAGGVGVGVGSTTITSNLFYVQDRYDGAAAVFESDTLDAHVNVYSKPPVGILPGHTEAVMRVGLDNAGAQPGLYFGVRPNLTQTASMHVDPSNTGLERFASFTRQASSTTAAPTYAGTVLGSLAVRDAVNSAIITDGSGAMLSGGVVWATAVGVGAGVGVPQAALHVEADANDRLAFLVHSASNVNLSLQGGGGRLDVDVDSASGATTITAGGSNAMRIASDGSITFLSSATFTVPIASATMHTDAIHPLTPDTAVQVQDLAVTGSLSVNGVPFTLDFWEFTGGGQTYVPGMGGGAGVQAATLKVPLMLGPLPADVAWSASSNTPLLLTNATPLANKGGSDAPLDVLVLARGPPGTNDTNAGSTVASLAVGRWSGSQFASNGQCMTRLDVRLAGASACNVVSAMTVVCDASGTPRVGIGGVVPRFALDVSGDLNVTGSYFQAAENVNINNTVMITPGQLTLADSNVVIHSRYCGIGTAFGDPATPTLPLDVYNNVGGTSLARFSTSNATGVATLQAAGGAASASLTVSASGLALAFQDTTLNVGAGSLTIGSASAPTSWQLLSDASGGAFRVRDAAHGGQDRLLFDASGTATLLGYTFASNVNNTGALTLANGPTGAPFVYFYGAQGGVGIGTATFPFNVLTQTLTGDVYTMGGDLTGNVTATTVNSAPLRLVVNGAISCYAISSFTGQHLAAFNHPNFKAEYIGLIVSLTGRLMDNAFTVDQSTPIVEFARTRMDKAAYGVLCSCKGGSPYQYICLVNSVGEGAMWVCNVNGDFALGDYITTSSVAGYGMRQDDDLLHNYTVAKTAVAVPFGILPAWLPSKRFAFKDPYDREIKNITACLVPVTYHCA